MISGDPYMGKNVRLDEALFLHNEQGNQIWAMGKKKLSQINY